MLVTLWTAKGEQIDLNLREDVTIGDLRRTLVNEFAYLPNVQIMYSTRICKDDAAVDDYPPGTLIVVGARQQQVPQQQQQQQQGYGAYNTAPYATHSSSGGTTLRSGHAGGMRAAAEKKYANDYNEVASHSRGGYAQQPQQHQQQPQATGYAHQYQQQQQQRQQPLPQQQFHTQPSPQQYQYPNQQPSTYQPKPQQQQQYPQQQYGQQPQQQFYTPQQQQQHANTTSTNYTNYMNSAAARGMQMPQTGANTSGWSGGVGHMEGITTPTAGGAGGNSNSSAYNGGGRNGGTSPQYANQSANHNQPPSPFGSNYNRSNSPQKSPAQESLGSAANYGSPKSTTANNRTATPGKQRAETDSAMSPSAQSLQSQEEAAYFPPVTLLATIVGQGEEKNLTVEIDGAATVSDLVSLLAERASEVGANIRPSQDSVKLMFFRKYLRNWQDPIRKVPLSNGSNVVVCTGPYVNEQQMTLHSAERAIVQVTREAKEALNAGELSSGRKSLLNEALMKALLDLDSLQDVEEDVRARRRALVKEVTKLQDDIAEGKISG